MARRLRRRGARVDVQGHELDDALGSAEDLVLGALEADRAGVAVHHAGDPQPRVARELDDGGVGVDLRHAPHDAAAVDHRGALGNAVVRALADDHPLPPAREVALDHARVLVAESLDRGHLQEALQPLDLRLELAVLLHGDRVLGVDPGHVAARLDQLVLRVEAQRPEALQVAHVGGGHARSGAVISKKLARARLFTATGTTSQTAKATPSARKGRAWSDRWGRPILTRSA